MGPLFDPVSLPPPPLCRPVLMPVLTPVNTNSQKSGMKHRTLDRAAEHRHSVREKPLPGIETFLKPLNTRQLVTLTPRAETVKASAMKPNVVAGVEWYQKMPVEERYRLLVDEQLLKDEKGTEMFENREPGCLRGGASMYEFITERLPAIANVGELINTDYLKQLHLELFSPIRKRSRSCKAGKKLQSKGEFRKKRVFFMVKANYTLKGLQQAEAFSGSLSEQKKDFFHVSEYASGSPMASKVVKCHKPCASKLRDYLDDDRYTVDFSPVKHNHVEAALKNVLSDYKEKLASVRDEKTMFSLLSELASRIDQIHPFEDGNIRVVRGLIDSILMFYGYCPIVWNDPNIIDLYDSRKLSEIMSSSVRNTKRLITKLQSGGRLGRGRYRSTEEDRELSRNAFEPVKDELSPHKKRSRRA